MKLITHIEVMRRALDEMADEHDMQPFLAEHSDLINAMDQFERAINRILERERK